ncbi:MAG: helix-hairpin-helix domain-containing protein [Bacteroidota bacterium]|nr:helix-hairpin-helix domain-containing protein [Bacteroidota bacterium]
MIKIAGQILLILFVVTARAQTPEVQQTLEDLMESLGSEPDENSDFQEIMDDLAYFGQHPLLINSATKEELQRLHFLSDILIDDLIEFRKKTGQIYSLYEMAAIEGFNPELLNKLEPFISFDMRGAERKSRKSDNDVFVRSTRAFSAAEGGVKNPNYEGTMERYYLRFKHKSSDLEYGFVAEKDPGEAFFAGSNKYGFDYAGAYGNFKVGSTGQRVFVGDFHVRFGQGLVAWQGFSMGKSSETTQTFRSGQGIRSSSSTDENQFFRGIASQLKFGKFNFMPFVSFRSLDANVDTIEGKPFFGAFQTSGYHRTKSEIAGKDALNQIAGGAYASFSYQRWSVGATAVFTRFNAEMDRNDVPENQFLWEGKENFVAGIDWKGSVRNVFIFGEAAVSANNGKALLTGIMLKPASNAEFTAVYRNINKTYFSFFANSFTESSRTNDEQALYFGFKFFPAPRWTIRTYADFFEHRWIKYTTAAPSKGTELFAQVSYAPSRKTDIYLRFFQEDKELKVTSGNLRFNQPQRINRLRLNFSCEINENFSIKNRIELSLYSKLEKEKGYLVYQDLIYKPVGKRFSMNGRLAYFETNGYNSRLYAYENDLLYSFSIPALYGKGIRSYFNFRQALNDKLTFWLKFAATRRFSQSGMEEPADLATKSELKIQLRYQF